MLSLASGWHLGDAHTLVLTGVGAAMAAAAVGVSGRRLHGVSFSVLYLGLGLVGAVALSVLDVKPLDPEADSRLVERLCELALIVAVFAAGLTIEREVRRRSIASIAVLLLVVMPLTIAGIAAFGAWAMGLSFGAAVLLGAVLAPTDPVLAGDVGLSGPGGDVLGEPRLSLHTEAGFNDGLASPFVVLGLLAASPGGTGWIGTWVLADLLYGAGAALVLGALVGHLAAASLTWASHAAWVTRGTEGLAALGVTIALYGAAEALGTYGLLAVFAAGFTFRRYEFEHEIHGPVHHGGEAIGKALELLVVVLLGTMITTEGLSVPGLSGWLLVPALLLVIRPVLVLAVTNPSFLTLRERLFLGFFGVRGVAALFYATVVVQAGVLRPEEQHVLVWTTLVCVACSIVVHGLSATGLKARWLSARSPTRS